MPVLKDETTKVNTKEITIAPITRLEGEAKISIFLDDNGNVENAYFQTVELRGFEQFCKGRPVEEMARITPRICGVCPTAHHMASTKALDGVFNVEPTETAKKLRELEYMAFYIHDHSAVFYALSAPDFVLGPAAPPEQRNIFGVIGAVGLELGKKVIQYRAMAHKIIAMLGGKGIHPVNGLPGGVSKGLTEDERREIERMSKELVDFGRITNQIFADVVLKNEDYVNIVTGDLYYQKTHYMALVDENDRVNFYDGKVKVVDPEGKELYRFDGKDYLDYIAERTEPWTYIKIPYLKKVGWKGFVEGADSGVYRVGPLARFNVASGLTTPEAQEAYEQMYSILPKPSHHILAYHWARVIEILYSAERMLELAQDPEITSKDLRNPVGKPDEGVGVVEAPRGVLIHHYKADENAMLTDANLIVSTTHNNAPIDMSVKKAAQGLIKNFEVSQGLLNMVEMAFRAYDPCLACATHTLPGQMPFDLEIRKRDGSLYRKMRNY